MVASLATANALAVPDIQPVSVAPDVYYVQGISALGSTENQNFISNAGFVVTRDSVVTIDALGSPAVAERVVAEIRKITPKPISHVILTHYHADHVYGLQVFKALGAQVIAHTLGKAYLNSDTARLRLEASRKDIAPWIDDKTQLVPADVWLEGPTEMTIGGTRFVIQPAGPAHTPEDLAIYLPQQKVLFAGDIVFRNRIPYVGTADSRHWIASLDALLALDARTIVPGHGPASDEPKKDLQQTRDYLVFLRAAMKKAATDMTPFDEAYAATDWSRFESLPLFKVANRMNAYNTYLLMEQEAR
ncbi:MBL fold metallo-hydrolase [Variovorax sp. PAMC26660]|uniref:MBL fold metallo-hydrolase n=1 Tax=Variovorax sp. PAMC26660 TaxID=2762322 RepID=UPI0021C2A783|nr:MBL fold metallo-hydrolase [Variovorax sp. PAMC26660]